MRRRSPWQRRAENLPAIGGILAVIALAALLAIGIVDAIHSIPTLHEGTVVDKTFRAACTEVVMLSISDGNGKTTRYPLTYHHPNRWTIQVVGTTAEDERRVECWEIGEGFFDQIAIGDYVYRDTKSDVVTMERKEVLFNAASGDCFFSSAH